MASLDRLPVELIIHIVESCRSNAEADGRPTSPDIAALARTNRKFYKVVNPLLYQYNLKVDHPSKSCIFWAVEHGRIDTIDTAFFFGADLDVCEDPWGLDKPPLIDNTFSTSVTPLFLAVVRKHNAVLMWLVGRGANPHVLCTFYCTACNAHIRAYPLHVALQHSTLDYEAKILISMAGAYMLDEICPALEIYPSLSEPLVSGLFLLPGQGPSTAALVYAMRVKQPSLASSVLARAGYDASWADGFGNTPLHHAVKLGDKAVVEMLFGRPEVNAGAQDANGLSPLHVAASTGNVAILRLLFGRFDVDVEVTDSAGTTPLQLAALKRNWAVVEELLLHPNVDPNGSNGDQYIIPLHEAIKGGNTDLAGRLLDRPDVSPGLYDKLGYTALDHACACNDLSIATLLLSRPPWVNSVQTGQDSTELMFHALSSQTGFDVLQFLVQGPFNINYRALHDTGATILHLLVQEGFDALSRHIAKLMIDQEAQIDGMDAEEYGTTPLTYAMRNGNLDMAVALLSYGANPYINCRAEANWIFYSWIQNAFTSPVQKQILCHPQQATLLREFLRRGGSANVYVFPYNGDQSHFQENSTSAAVPLLFMAASIAENIDCMKILLDAGADVHAPVHLDHKRIPWVDDDNDNGLCLGGRRSVLSAMFHYEDDFWTRGVDERDGESDAVERVVLLLEHGASLEFKDTSASGLEHACELSQMGYPSLLRVLLTKATARNVSKVHVFLVWQQFKETWVGEQLKKFALRTFFN